MNAATVTLQKKLLLLQFYKLRFLLEKTKPAVSKLLA